MSLLKSKHSGWTWDLKRTPFTGGGGPSGSSSSAPSATSQTQTVSNISPWAQPIVANLANQQLANMFPNQTVNADGSINLGQQAGYTAFGQNGAGIGPNQMAAAQSAVAGFSPLQQQAQQGAANLSMPGQFGTATGMAGAAGQNLMNSAAPAMAYGNLGSAMGTAAAGMAPQAQQYGAAGANIGTQGGLGYGAQGFQAGQGAAGYGAIGAQQGASYGQNATNAQAVQQYMNPYLQATLNPAMQLQQQQFGQINAQNQGQATQQGAFGGGRQAVTQGLNQQNQMLAQNQLVGTAYNQAYNTANQNMQQAAALGMQGANVGIQGQQAAISGAQTGLQGVGQALAGQQLGLSGLNTANTLYNTGISGAQTGLAGVNAAQAGYTGANAAAANLGNLGTQQLAAQQGILNTQNQMGNQQQANQQAVINQAIQNYANTQNYPMQQAYNAEGLLTGAPTAQTQTQYTAAPNSVNTILGAGAVTAGAMKVAKGGAIKEKRMASGGIASGVPPQKLDAMLGRLDDQQLAAKTNLQMNDPQTAQAAQGQQAFRAQMRPAGIGQNYNFQAAGGGIVAFAEGKEVKDDSSSKDIKSVLMQEYNTPVEQQIAQNKAMMPNQDFIKEYTNKLGSLAPTPEDTSSMQGLRLIQGGMGLLSNQGPFFDATKAMPAVEGYAQDVQRQKQQQIELAKQQFDLAKFGYSTEADIVKAVQADRKGTRDDLIKILGSETAADATIKSAQIHAGATIQAAGISADKASAKERQGIQTEFDALVAQGYDEKSPITKQMAQQQYFAATRPYGASSMMSALAGEIAKDGQIKTLNTQLQIAGMGGDKDKVKEIQDQIAARTKEIQATFKDTAASMRPGAPNPAIPQPNPVTTGAASNAGAQFTWDLKQNKLVPVGQPQQ